MMSRNTFKRDYLRDLYWKSFSKPSWACHAKSLSMCDALNCLPPQNFSLENICNDLTHLIDRSLPPVHARFASPKAKRADESALFAFNGNLFVIYQHQVTQKSRRIGSFFREAQKITRLVICQCKKEPIRRLFYFATRWPVLERLVCILNSPYWLKKHGVIDPQ